MIKRQETELSDESIDYITKIINKKKHVHFNEIKRNTNTKDHLKKTKLKKIERVP